MEIEQEVINALSKRPHFEKLYRIPHVYYRTWLEKNGSSFRGARVLDFGCGEGLTSTGLSLFCEAESVLGVEIGSDYQRLGSLLQEITPELQKPSNVSFRTVSPGASLGTDEFDVIVSWSVLEHVAQDIFDKQMRILAQALKPNGIAVFQIAPLYHSPFGSHLMGVQEPWEHLTGQLDLLKRKVFEKAGPAAEGMWNCFLTLNRFGEMEFRDRISASGLNIVDSYETFVADRPGDKMLRLFDGLALTKNQILLVCRKS